MMAFNSIQFLFFFLPVALGIYHLTPRRGRNAVLVVESLVFYLWSAGAFVLVLLASTGIAYVSGLLVERAKAADDGRRARRWVWVGVVINLAMLVVYKYAGWILDGLDGLVEIDWKRPALPLGISFFTFQAISYIVDVGRGRAHRSRDPLSFALYVTLFPHLIAGPIIRYRMLEEQLHDRTTTVDDFAAGAIRFVHGLVKKVVIADAITQVVDVVYGLPPSQVSFGVAWLGAIAFALQLYFDFSGYTDMAIGLGRMFGFVLPENFRRPFSATSITDFWLRWHITLSSWFRDYVYAPLRGRGHGEIRTCVALVATFALVGLWHGANWTFVAFGAIHGTVMVVERLTGQDRVRAGVAATALRRVVTLVILLVTIPFFRAPSAGFAVRNASAMLSPGRMRLPFQVDFFMSNHAVAALVLAGVVFVLPRSALVGRWLSERGGWSPNLARAGLLVAALPYATALMAAPSQTPFIYFRF